MILILHLAGIIILFVFLQGLLSGSEIAMVTANRQRLSRFAHTGPRSARLTFRILQEPSWFLSTALVGSNLAGAANAALVTSIMVRHYGANGALYAFLLLTPLILLFAEIFPKTFFQQKADQWVLRIVPVIWILSMILYPLVWLMSKVTGGALRFLRQEKKSRPLLTREELQLLLRTEGEQTDMKPMEKDMIHRIFRLSVTKVREVMIPLVDVVAIEENTPLEEAIATVRQENFSRYPVFRERVDNIVGVLHGFDLLFARGEEGIQPLIHPITYFPETAPADELFLNLQKKREAMAAVVDEYGGAVGIITLEDILEEVVGEISDEFDIEPPLYKRLGPKKFLINARMEIDHINDILKIGLPKGDYETLGGFILEQLGRVPLAGDSFRFKDIIFQVQKADERSVSEVLVTIKE